MSTPSRNCTQVSLALIQKTAKQRGRGNRGEQRAPEMAPGRIGAAVDQYRDRDVGAAARLLRHRQEDDGAEQISNERIRPVGRRIEEVARGYLVAIGAGDEDDDQRSELISAARDRIMQAAAPVPCQTCVRMPLPRGRRPIWQRLFPVRSCEALPRRVRPGWRRASRRLRRQPTRVCWSKASLIRLTFMP